MVVEAGRGLPERAGFRALGGYEQSDVRDEFTSDEGVALRMVLEPQEEVENGLDGYETKKFQSPWIM